MLELARNPALQQTVARSSRTHDHRPGIDLPAAGLGRARLRDALAARHSRAARGRRRFRCLLSLHCSMPRTDPRWTATHTVGRRPVSAGGLRGRPRCRRYRLSRPPLQPLSPSTRASCAGDARGCFRFSRRSGSCGTRFGAPVVTAMFWRTRFKYGLRGYRFALLEAGHVVQNAVLAATAMRVAALPLGASTTAGSTTSSAPTAWRRLRSTRSSSAAGNDGARSLVPHRLRDDRCRCARPHAAVAPATERPCHTDARGARRGSCRGGPLRPCDEAPSS